MPERPVHAREGKLVPGNFGPVEQPDLATFRAGRDLRRQQPGPVDHLYLADARDVVDADQRVDLDTRTRFLPGLAQIGRAHVCTPSLMRISYAVFCLNKNNKNPYDHESDLL